MIESIVKSQGSLIPSGAVIPSKARDLLFLMEALEKHKPVDPVLLGEALLYTQSVLQQSACQIVRYPGVQNTG